LPNLQKKSTRYDRFEEVKSERICFSPSSKYAAGALPRTIAVIAVNDFEVTGRMRPRNKINGSYLSNRQKVLELGSLS